MRYYRRQYNSSEWKRISWFTALLMLKRPRSWCPVRWHIDMLMVPNIIYCADAELKVTGDNGEQPIKGLTNLRYVPYCEDLKRKVLKEFADLILHGETKEDQYRLSVLELILKSQ